VSGAGPLNVWLDDKRQALVGFMHVRTASECIALFERTPVHEIHCVSLDHDLGTCDACGGFNLDSIGLPKSCEHNGTGYQVVCWMEANGYWPAKRPLVHSANPAGRQRMQQVIARHYDARSER